MDWIQGEKFKAISDFTYIPKVADKEPDGLINTLNPYLLKDGDIVYTHTKYVHRLFEILNILKTKVVVVTHNSDTNATANESIPSNVIHWFTQNVNTENPNISSIPIGLENSHWVQKSKKLEKMVAKTTEPKLNKNLIYINHNIQTNVKERKSIYTLLQNKKWCTTQYGHNGIDFDAYLDGIYHHQFVACPEGNGIDTHRTWECLYMGSIPIEKRNLNNRFYQDLPICFVNDWSEITEDFLLQEYARIKSGAWNMKKLKFKYWETLIKNKYGN